MEKNRTKIRINGIEYTIAGYETEEYMQKVAKYVDNKMNEIKQKCFSLDSAMIAVLTAVNIADDNLKLYDRVDDLEKEVEELKAQLEAKNVQNNHNNHQNNRRNH